MDKIKILGLRKDKADILAMLQNDGVVELIETEQKFLGNDKKADLAKTDEVAESVSSKSELTETAADKNQLEQKIQEAQNNRLQLENTIKYLEEEFPNVLVDPKALKFEVDEFLNIRKYEKKILGELDRIQILQEELQNYAADKVMLEKEQILLKDWLEIDLNLAENATQKTRYFLGSIAAEQLSEFEKSLQETDFPIIALPLKKQKDRSLLAIITLEKNELETDHLLKQSSFCFLPITKAGTPGQIYTKNNKLLSELKQNRIEAEAELKKLAQDKLQFYVLSDYYANMVDQYIVSGYAENTISTFWIEGYVQSDLADLIKQKIEENFVASAEIEILSEEDEYPILLQNRPFAQSFQSVLEMFGAPNNREIDPTPGLAPFYFIFFGMMLSDVGYGIILTLLCAFLLFKKKVDLETESGDLVRMLFLCGMSSTAWGFVFGGFFGDLLTVMSDGQINFPALWFNPMDDPQRLMIWSMIFGVIHLYGGMVMKIINEVKFGKISNAVFDVIPWYFLITGLGLMAGASSLNTATLNFTEIGKWLSIIGAGIILLFAGREKKNPVARLFSGVGSLYNAIGFIGDILSYTRILALVLATSVIATVVNFLAKMLMGNILGAIFAVLVLLGGHALNLALSALSAYVHTSRLQYVEYFGKFFEGGGRFFKPLKYNTKHIKINNQKIKTN